MKKYIFPALIIVLGLLITFAPFGFAQVCGPKADGGMMKCFWMGQSVRLLGGMVVILGLVFAFVEKAGLGIVISNIVLAIGIALLPLKIIGTCKMPTMSCNAHTKPVVLLLAIFLIIVNAVYLFLNRKSEVK